MLFCMLQCNIRHKNVTCQPFSRDQSQQNALSSRAKGVFVNVTIYDKCNIRGFLHLFALAQEQNLESTTHLIFGSMNGTKPKEACEFIIVGFYEIGRSMICLSCRFDKSSFVISIATWFSISIRTDSNAINSSVEVVS